MYGGAIETWLALPMWKIIPFLKMIPVLRAEESLRKVEEFAIGAGWIQKHDRNKILARWRKEAGQYKAGEKRKLTLDRLTAPGLPIVEVKKGG